jgi:hypothetical protein
MQPHVPVFNHLRKMVREAIEGFLCQSPCANDARQRVGIP